MAFLDRFKSVSAEQRYSDILKSAKDHLKMRNATFELTSFLWNADLVKEVNKISKKHAEYYARSRFLGGVFSAIWAIQRKGYWTSEVIKERRLKETWRQTSPKNFKKELEETNILNQVLSSNDSELKAQLIKSISVAAAMLTEGDPDVDIKVARDLGKSKGYPERPPLPTGVSVQKDKIFSAASIRVKLFWQHVTGFPIPRILELFFASCEKKRGAG